MRRWRAGHGHDRRAAQLRPLASRIDSASRSPISSISRSQRRVDRVDPGPTHSGVDFLARGSRRNPDDDPAQCGEFLETLDVLGELAAVGAVVVTVVLDGDLEVLPAHIQEVGPAASPHPNLSLRLGKARLDDEQPQPGFLRGFRSGVIQAQHSRNLANPTNSAMAGSDVQHVGAVEGRRCTEGVQPRHGAPQQRAARQVEGGARQGRDRDAAQHDRLPRCKTERRGDDARRGPSVRPGQFDRLDVVNPFGSVQPCRGES